MPFADYKDFDDCVAKNKDKEDPAAYCAAIKQKAESEEGREHVVSDLFEAVEADFSTDESTGELRSTNVIIRAGRSKNNREYRESALRTAGAKGLFNGIRMFVDHRRGSLPTQRSVNEMVAGIEKSWYDESKKALMGDVVYFDSAFHDKVKRAQGFLGNSISALVRGTRVKDSTGTFYEDIAEIVRPKSVDWVIFPAAGGGVESFATEGEDQVDFENLTLEELEAGAPQLVESIKIKYATTPPADPPKDEPEMVSMEAVEALVEKKLGERLQSIEAVEAEQSKIREHIGKAALPERTRARLMVQFQTATTFDAAKVDEAITDAREELKAAGAGPQITGQGPSGDPTTPKATVRRASEAVDAAFGVTRKAGE
jgi:hypothetical protein